MCRDCDLPFDTHCPDCHSCYGAGGECEVEVCVDYEEED